MSADVISSISIIGNPVTITVPLSQGEKCPLKGICWGSLFEDLRVIYLGNDSKINTVAYMMLR